MPAKMAKSDAQALFRLPEVMVAVRASLLSYRKAGKPRISKPVRESSGESWFKSNTQEECFQVPSKIARSAPQPAFQSSSGECRCISARALCELPAVPPAGQA